MPILLRRSTLTSLLLILAAVACTPRPDTGDPDAGTSRADAAITDGGGASDASRPDAARTDAGRMDDGGMDAGRSDAGSTDGGQQDAGSADASMLDASTQDAAVQDAGQFDAALPDAGAADSGADAGMVADAGGDAGSASTDAGPDGGAAADAGDTRISIRVMAANLTTGNLQKYDNGEGIRIMQGLDPDVILVQEFNYLSNTTANFDAMTAAVGDSSWSWCREDASLQIPNGIISRWPIIECGSWNDPSATNREFAYARIDVPGTRDLWAVSLHLLTSSPTTRNNEATALVAFITQVVPATDLLVVGGDLNTDVDTEACLATLGSIVATSPQPVDQDGNPNTNTSRTRPYDWVLPDDDLAAAEVPVIIGNHSFPDGLVFDSRVYSPLTDVPPVLATDSSATNMQHMAVVKQFFIAP